ncbi:unnamed protein product [Rotaria sp. Silwood1]|nr:unnamed protein product [Rotaria sp. Silwood1]
MSQISKFTFNIRSTIRLQIQHTFNDFQNNKIISCIDYVSQMKQRQFHIYLYLRELKYYHQITNNFPF